MSRSVVFNVRRSPAVPIPEYPHTEGTDISVLLTAIVGVITGFTAGMFGIGGALLATPLLREIVGLPELMALASPLPATLPAALSGSIVYARKKLLRFDVARWVLVTGIPFNVLGARLVVSMSGELMMILTGIILIYSAGLFMNRSLRPGARARSEERDNQPERSLSPMALMAVGVATGFASGFLAIGGGMVMVPAFAGWLRLPTKQALATSLFCVALLAVPGIVTHEINGFIDWKTALILSAAVFPVSALGARVATVVRSHVIELVYGIAMFVFAAIFISRYL